MHRVRKNCFSHVFRRKDNVGDSGIAVAGVAMTRYAITSGTIMTGLAGITIFQLLHSFPVRGAFVLGPLGLAIEPTQLIYMDRVRKWYSTRIFVFNLEDNVNGFGVAFDAIALDAECGVAVMAGAACFAVLHVLHSRWVRALFGFKYFGMTFLAIKLFSVERVRERDITDIFVRESFVDNAGVAVNAVCNTKCCGAIVAVTT